MRSLSPLVILSVLVLMYSGMVYSESGKMAMVDLEEAQLQITTLEPKKSHRENDDADVDEKGKSDSDHKNSEKKPAADHDSEDKSADNQITTNASPKIISPKAKPTTKKVSKTSVAVKKTNATVPTTTNGVVKVLCTIASLFGDIHIQYTRNDDSIGTTDVPVSTEFDTAEECKQDESHINMTWTPNGASHPFDISFIARRVRNIVGAFQSATQPADEFEVAEVNLAYTVEESLFPGAKSIGEIRKVRSLNWQPIRSPVGTSYACSNPQVYSMDKDTKITIKNMQFETFRTVPGIRFGPSGSTCSSGWGNYQIIIPALVGVVCAIVICLVVATVIGRRRRHQGYTRV